MSLLKELNDLGFQAAMPGGEGDFRLRDDSDGLGPYIAEWLSDKPCPLPNRMRRPIHQKLPQQSQ